MINSYMSISIINNYNMKSKKINDTSSKLASGLRIKSAKDDAAGLAISNKMRSQIRGLEQANRNVQDGISLIQVAEGALNEIQSITQRINELSIQSSNGILDDEDRCKIQLEVSELIDEIDNITNTTEFNGVKVLQGKEKFDIVSEVKEGGMPAWVAMPNSGALDNPSSSAEYAKAEIDFSKLDKSNIADLLGQGFYSTCCTCDEKYSIKFTNTDQESTGRPNPIIIVNISGISTGEELVDEIIKQATPKLTHFTQVSKDPNNPNKLIIYDNRPGQNPNPNNGYGIVEEGIIRTEVKESDPDIYIQDGPNANNSSGLHLPRTFIDSLGLDSINLKTQDMSRQAVHLVSKTLEILSNEIARMGAYENKFESTQNILLNSQENLTNAESRIRDCDIAKETVKLSKDKILEQATISMISMVKDLSSQSITLLLNN